MERRAERQFLLAHFLCNPPSHVNVVWPPGVERGDARALDIDRITIPSDMYLKGRSDRTADAPITIDLAGYTKSSRRGKRGATRPNSVFAQGWKKFSQDFPLRSLPPFAEESLRRLDLVGNPSPTFRSTRAVLHTREGSGHSSDGSTSMQNSLVPPMKFTSTVIHRRKLSSGGDGTSSPLLTHTTVTLTQLAGLKKKRPSDASGGVPRVYPTTSNIEFITVAHSPALEALELEGDFLNNLVYYFVLLSTSLLMSRDARDLAPQVLRHLRPALGIADTHHAAAMLSLVHKDQRGSVETTTDVSKLTFQQVLLNDMPCTAMDVWIRAASGAESPNSPVSGDAVEEAEYNFAVSAQRFLQICAHASAVPTMDDSPVTVLPPVVAAVLYAGALQCLYFSIDPQSTQAVEERDVVRLLATLQRSLGIPDHLVPYCRLHGLILALRTLLGGTMHLEARGELIHTNFFTTMAELLSYLDTEGLEDAPITEYNLYKVYVLQETVDSSLGLMELFDSISNDALALSLCQAFCAACTVLPPAFLSVHIRCNGIPLICGKAGDSTLMELLSHYVGGAVLKELGDPDVWLDPTEPLSVAIAHVDAACMRPTPFLRVWSEYLPQAEALVVPMLVQIVSYVFGLYWGRSANEELSAAVPPQFVEGIRSLYFRIASKLPEDVRTYIGLLDVIREAVDKSLAWLVPLYERHVNVASETLSGVIAMNAANAKWGGDGEESDKALQKVFDCLEEAIIPLRFPLGTNLESIFQRSLVAAVSAIGRTAQQICGPFVLPSIEDQEKETPELFHPISSTSADAHPAAAATNARGSLTPVAAAPTSTLHYYPLDLGICKQHLIRATKLKPMLQGASPLDVLSRMKYLHWLRRDLETFVETFYLTVWCASIFRKALNAAIYSPCRDRGRSTGDDPAHSPEAAKRPFTDEPTIMVLKSVVEEALHNINRFYGNLAETLALRVVHYGSLHNEMHEKLLKLDIRFYRAHKYDKRFLAAEGKNAHLRPLYPQYTMDTVLDGVERELHAFVRQSPAAETIVRISAYIYAHLTSLYTFIILDGGDERWFYPDQSKALLADVDMMESFLTKNIPDCSVERHHGDVGTLWDHISTEYAIESCKWFDSGNAVVRSLRSILGVLFPVSSEDLVHGGEGVPAFHTLQETRTEGETPFCRYLVRRILCHRKDQTAKKFVKSLS
jgi:hypothetical protein